MEKKGKRRGEERKQNVLGFLLARCTDKKKLVHVVRPASNGVPFFCLFF